jgi:SAM-dependent methyltransferase
LSEWYETFFDALAFDVWRSLAGPEMSDSETEFLLRQLCRTDGERSRFLDVPCGDGRLALRVAAAGHQVVGVDLSGVAIDRLRQEAGTTTSAVTGRVGDMRDLGSVLEADPLFDGAWCMGNSFGYLKPSDTVAFLDDLSASLRVGARFVLDAATAAETALPHVGGRDRYEADGAVLINEHSYDVRQSTMVTDMTLAVGERKAQRIARAA